MIFTSILDKDDEVMMAEPFYTNYHAFISAASGKIVPITTSPEDGYFYADSAKLEAAYNERCKAIAIVNPGNPTGCIISKEDMKEYLEDTKGNFVGIGIYMVKNTSKDRIEVLSPIKNSPAEKARN